MRRTRTRTLLRRLTLALVTVCLAASSASAQDKDKGKKEKAAEQPFEVRLNVTVLDAAGQPVTNLRAEDFRVTEDGAAQQVKQLTRHEAAPVIGIVVDNTGSLRHLINVVVDFARLVVEGSDPRSEIFVERFVDSSRITVMQDFTTNKAAHVRALDEMYVEGGQSAITDALYLAAEHLSKRKDEAQPARRRALVLITDGEDRANRHKPEQLFARLREAGIQVFVVSLTNIVKLQTSPEKAAAYMNRIAAESGGALWLPDKKTSMSGVAGELIQELNAPYTLVYAPTNQRRDGSTRKPAVTLADAPDAAPRRVFVRGSYTAPKK